MPTDYLERLLFRRQKFMSELHHLKMKEGNEAKHIDYFLPSTNTAVGRQDVGYLFHVASVEVAIGINAQYVSGTIWQSVGTSALYIGVVICASCGFVRHFSASLKTHIFSTTLADGLFHASPNAGAFSHFK